MYSSKSLTAWKVGPTTNMLKYWEVDEGSHLVHGFTLVAWTRRTFHPYRVKPVIGRWQRNQVLIRCQVSKNLHARSFFVFISWKKAYLQVMVLQTMRWLWFLSWWVGRFAKCSGWTKWQQKKCLWDFHLHLSTVFICTCSC